ncbi:MAG: NADH:flavin oxidoreductase [Clostridia bacterium]|nr:NADH:flavin oxidoreductase [Clostridia bacterium]
MEIFERTRHTNWTSKNRLVRSATWDGLASPEGFLNDEIYSIYAELAKGGVGTIVTGLTDVSPYNWALLGNMRLCSDALISDYRRLTELVHRYDCNIWSQLNMSEFVRTDKRIAPVDIDAMTVFDLQTVAELFVDAAIRAEEAEFDGVQLHLAYGWFFNRLVNPAFNHRTDNYGGTTENRTRLIKEVIGGIHARCPSLHVSAKFSFFDDDSGGFDVSEGVNICRELEKGGLNSLETIGGHSPKEKGTKYESCYLDLGLAVRSAVQLPLILTGNNHDVESMNRILNSCGIDFFGMSRPLIREPNLPARWESGDTAPASCISCSRCYTTHGKRCIFV